MTAPWTKFTSTMDRMTSRLWSRGTAAPTSRRMCFPPGKICIVRTKMRVWILSHSRRSERTTSLGSVYMQVLRTILCLSRILGNKGLFAPSVQMRQAEAESIDLFPVFPNEEQGFFVRCKQFQSTERGHKSTKGCTYDKPWMWSILTSTSFAGIQ